MTHERRLVLVETETQDRACLIPGQCGALPRAGLKPGLTLDLPPAATAPTAITSHT
jgi:hypothetical protein